MGPPERQTAPADQHEGACAAARAVSPPSTCPREQHTVLDFRSTEALNRLGELDGQGGYLAYLAVCRGLAGRLKVSLRGLDRALWRWSKDGYREA